MSIRVRSKLGKARLDELDPGDRVLLELGPPSRLRARADWPAEMTRLRVLWGLNREALLAASPPGLRPWSFWAWDCPAAVRTPGPIQGALIADGTMTQIEAALVASHDGGTARRHRRPKPKGET